LACLPCAVFAGTDCKKEASHSYPASQVGYANEEQKYYLCGSLESSCLHPDPSYWAKNGKGTPYNQVCLGPNEEGGQDVSRATENGVACTFTKYDPAEPEGCDPSWVVMGDLGVYFYYTPCTNYTGNVTVNCKTYRQGDDWMDGNPATATRYITGGEFTFTLDIQEKPCNATLCTGTGSCQPVRIRYFVYAASLRHGDVR